MKIALCGPSQCGKDTAARWLAANTPLRFTGSTSRVIAPVVAERLGVSLEVAWATRHKHRREWYDIGNELRANDPAFLARTILVTDDIVAGLRDRDELTTIIAENLVDLAVWIDRPGQPFDATMRYGPELCDIVILNHWSERIFLRRVETLAKALGLMGREGCGCDPVSI